MICRPCKEAGRALQMSRSAGDWIASGLRAQVILLHDECEAPSTCPCQHRTSTLLLPATAPRDLGAFSNNSG